MPTLGGSISPGLQIAKAGRPAASLGASREAQAGGGRLMHGPEPGHHPEAPTGSWGPLRAEATVVLE